MRTAELHLQAQEPETVPELLAQIPESLRSVHVYRLLASAHEARQERSQAVIAYQKIIKLEPLAVEAYLGLLKLGVGVGELLSLHSKADGRSVLPAWLQKLISAHGDLVNHDYHSANAGFSMLETKMFPGNVDLMLKAADTFLKIGDINKSYYLYMKVCLFFALLDTRVCVQIRKAEPLLVDDMDKYARLMRSQGKYFLVNRLAEEMLKITDQRPECFVILARYSEMNGSVDRAFGFLEKVSPFSTYPEKGACD